MINRFKIYSIKYDIIKDLEQIENIKKELDLIKQLLNSL